jgi:hypothetical protein
MGKLTEKFRNEGHEDVESLGLLWRVNRIRTIDLFRAGNAALIMSPIPDAVDAAQGGIPAPSPEEMAAQFQRMSAQQKEHVLAELERAQEAVIQAALSHVGERAADGVAWEPIEVVLTREEAVPGSNRVFVADLPQEARVAIYSTAMRISVGGKAAQAIERFRS